MFIFFTFQSNTLSITRQFCQIAAATISQRWWRRRFGGTTGRYRRQPRPYLPRSGQKSMTTWKRCRSSVGSLRTGTSIRDANGRWWHGSAEVPTSCSCSVTVSYHFWNCVFSAFWGKPDPDEYLIISYRTLHYLDNRGQWRTRDFSMGGGG